MRKQFNLWKKICAGAMALVTIGTTLLSGVEVQAKTSEAHLEAEQVPLQAESKKICVISDTHYYPLNYVTDCEDYKTYVGGDPKMLAESGSIIDSALNMIKKDKPDLVLISGDLTKDGEKLGHKNMAEKLQTIEDETNAEVFVINGNHDIYNYQDSCTFENGKKEKAETTTPAEFKEIYSQFGYNGEYDAQYYTPPVGKEAGGLSYSVTFGDYVIIGIDSGRYSPDADTGMDTNEHITAGRIDASLLPWVKNYVQTPVSTVPSEKTFQQTCPVYAGVTIDGGKLYYRAYQVKDGVSEIVDSFAIDKSQEIEIPEWEKVKDMITALPDMPTLKDASDIESARAAYDALGEEEKAQVPNVNRLLQAEKILHALQNINDKQTMHVNNKSDFVNALNNPNVGTIITDGAEIEFEVIKWFQAKENKYDITRDLRIMGNSKLTFVSFLVKNGATLILDGDVAIDDTRTQGSVYESLNPVEVYGNSTLITSGHVAMRTEYGTGGGESGICVKMTGEGSKAILGSDGSYWAAESAVYSSLANTEVIINDGTYERKNENHRAVDSQGRIEVNGGTIRNLWCKGNLYINGGTFDNGSVLNPQIPVDIEGNAYMTGGTIIPHDGNGVKLRSSGKLHILTGAVGNVEIGNAQPHVGAVTTSNYKDIEVRYHNINGSGEKDGIYETAAAASTVESLANAGGIKLEGSSAKDGLMTAVLGEGNHHVYGKYYLAGGGKTPATGFSVDDGGEAIVYGNTRFIENHPVTGAVIEGEDTRLVQYREGAEIRLNGYTLPANAFDNAVKWTSDPKEVAVVDRGKVTLKKTGTANITMTSKSNPKYFDTVKILAVDPKIQGDDVLEGEDSPKTYTLDLKAEGVGEEDRKRISYKWSVDDLSIATIDPDTGVLTKVGQGVVHVTAQLLLDGVATDVKVSKEVLVRDIVSVEITWGDMEYTYHEGNWNKDTHQYDGHGWTADVSDGDQIHIRNTGKAAIKAGFGYEAGEGFQSINGEFLKGRSLITADILRPEEETNVQLRLKNKPERYLKKETVGSVTITINQENMKR